MFDVTLTAKNSFEDQNAICPVNNKETKENNGKIQLTAKGLSWNMINLIKSGGTR
jgi:alpha-L-arabinofuranosidase